MKVLVVGNGGMGGAVSYHLSSLGAEVVTFDTHAPGHKLGSSFGETRLTRKAYFEAPEYVPLLKRAELLWQELEQESGQSLLVSSGLLIVGAAPSPLLRAVEQSASHHGIPVESYARSQCQARLPWATIGTQDRGVWEPGAGYLKVDDCVSVHFRLAQDRGMRFVQQTVVEWGDDPGGVWVRTAEGVEKGDRLVLAAGAQAGNLVRGLGADLSVHENAIFWVTPNGVEPDCCFAFELGEDFFYGFPVIGGRWKVAHHSPGPKLGEKRTFQVSPQCRKKIEGFLTLVCGGRPVVEEEQTCLYTMSPDGHFFVDRHPENPRVFILAGFSGHGFKFASVLGEAIAQGVYRGGLPSELKFLSLARLNS